MKTSVNWLKKYVDINCGVEDLVRRMVMAGFEAEGVEDPGAEISNVVVGRITKLEKHPNADRLQICQLDTGAGEPIQIVTGATNVFVGALVPVAKVGARLHGGVKIERSKLRGVESLGMLCAGAELGVDDALYPGASVDGILILREEYTLGANIKPILGISEPVVDFKITANRAADCMCVSGLAREASVVLGAPLRLPESSETAGNGEDISSSLKVTVKDADLCPRYMARVVRNVKIADSPLWMRQALANAGVRPINNIVDITNFVMLETGQPMHAFDSRYIRGGHIVVRRAAAGEQLMTLDGKTRELANSMLVIADEQGPIGLGGIMGGEHSGIYPDTTDIVFECANFEWSQIRITSRSLGMRTESSARYEKALPVRLPEEALKRAMALVTELGAGEIAPGLVDIHGELPDLKHMNVSVSSVQRTLGQPIPAATMADILINLGFKVEQKGDTLALTVPWWRQDMETFADIAEEVQRIYGYDSIPSTPPPGEALMGRRTQRQQDILKLKTLLAGMDLDEALSYSFMAPAALDRLGLPAGDPLRDAMRIRNPLGEDYSLMRTTLAPAMLRSVAANQSRKAASVRLFELGRTYKPDPSAQPRNADGGYSLSTPCQETETLCIAVSEDGADYQAIKGILEELLDRFGISGAEYRPGAPAYYHPGRSAAAYVGDAKIAVLGEAHPDAALAFGAERRVCLAEVNVDALLTAARRDYAIKPLPKYPSIERDLAVTADKQTPVGEMLKAIRRAGGSLLESAELFDVYEGAQAGEGRKSVAFSLVFRALDHTLVDDEASACFDAVVAALGKEFGAEIRK